jgi:oligopeptide/dipeptide ABC transporter ATP-binding protein
MAEKHAGKAAAAPKEDALLRIEGMTLHFDTYVGRVQALDKVDLTIRRNETLGLVGESGCGKSITAMSLLRLVPSPPADYVEGRILLDLKDGKPPRDLLALTEAQMQDVRGNDVSMIFQEPQTSLNPVMPIGAQIAEAVLRHQALGLDPPSRVERKLEERGWFLTRRTRERRRRALDIAERMLERIGIADPRQMLERYPHELSGGMRQRVMIAMALACKPALLVADEPTTALDVTIQAQIMDLMRELKREEEASILLITHHLGLVAEMCDRVAVMYAGSVVEEAPTHDAFYAPAHPYTVGLLKSIPSLEGKRGELPVIPGRVPDLVTPPTGCRFHPRCPFAMDICSKEKPPMATVGPDHRVACHIWNGSYEVPAELRNAGIQHHMPAPTAKVDATAPAKGRGAA